MLTYCVNTRLIHFINSFIKISSSVEFTLLNGLVRGKLALSRIRRLEWKFEEIIQSLWYCLN